ncbi:hypothetical protein BJV78DRAFT_77170 [Lactifluus subvellereus]|nr:hypothetical protein BJV78DRAFT_77170 [Lactifluus subvellereus]
MGVRVVDVDLDGGLVSSPSTGRRRLDARKRNVTELSRSTPLAHATTSLLPMVTGDCFQTVQVAWPFDVRTTSFISGRREQLLAMNIWEVTRPHHSGSP